MFFFFLISPCPCLHQLRHFILNHYLPELDSFNTCDIFIFETFKQLKFSGHVVLHFECVVNIILVLFNIILSSLYLRSQILGQLKVAGFIRPRGAGDIRDLNLNSSNWAVVKV